MGRQHLFVCLESFCKSSRVFFSLLSERVQSLDFRHNGTRSPHVMGESQTHSIELEMTVRTIQPEIHSTLTGEDSSKNYDADQQRLQISDLHFDKFPYTSHVCLLKDKIQD